MQKYAMRTNHETEGTVHSVCSEACEQVERNTVSGSIFEGIKMGPIALSNHTKFTDINKPRRMPVINKHSFSLLASQFQPTHTFGTNPFFACT